MSDLGLAVRPLEDGDYAFICGSWAQSNRKPPGTLRMGGEKAWLSNQRALANALLRTHGASVLVVAEHPSTILGWACGGPGYVVAAYWRPELHGSIAEEWIRRTLDAARGGK